MLWFKKEREREGWLICFFQQLNSFGAGGLALLLLRQMVSTAYRMSLVHFWYFWHYVMQVISPGGFLSG